MNKFVNNRIYIKAGYIVFNYCIILPCDLTLGPVEVKLYRSSMYLKRLYYLIFIFSYTSVFSQFEKWPEPPKRIIWLAANNASFGDGATNELPIDV